MVLIRLNSLWEHYAKNHKFLLPPELRKIVLGADPKTAITRVTRFRGVIHCAACKKSVGHQNYEIYVTTSAGLDVLAKLQHNNFSRELRKHLVDVYSVKKKGDYFILPYSNARYETGAKPDTTALKHIKKLIKMGEKRYSHYKWWTQKFIVKTSPYLTIGEQTAALGTLVRKIFPGVKSFKPSREFRTVTRLFRRQDIPISGKFLVVLDEPILRHYAKELREYLIKDGNELLAKYGGRIRKVKFKKTKVIDDYMP